MTTDNWIEVLLAILSAFGGLYALIRKDIKRDIEEQINKLKQELQNEAIADLKRQNEMLNDWFRNSK